MTTPAFVYIPGLPGDPSMFAFLEQPLRMLGFRPLHIDHMHLNADEVQMAVLVERVRALLDSEGVAEAVICGESFGATVAQSFARTYSKRTLALVLCGGFAHTVGNGMQIAMTRTPIIRDIAKNLPPFLTNFNRRIGAKSYTPNDPPALRATFDAIYVPQTRPYWEKARIALDFDSRGWLPELRMPALVMTGEHDAVVPRKYSEELARLLPNATLHIVPDTGHLAHFARPDVFVEQFSAFCRAHAIMPQPVAV